MIVIRIVYSPDGRDSGGCYALGCCYAIPGVMNNVLFVLYCSLSSGRSC